jgi:CHASE2 domain-containing sensor protein
MSAIYPASNDYYKVGGSLPPDTSSYVIRQVDLQFYEALRSMKFCYVFNARQMGKSSLRVRTMAALTEEGFACVAIEMRDLLTAGVTQEEFYSTIVSHLASNLNLDINPGNWWRKHDGENSLNRLINFIKNELLKRIDRNIVIFFDEIDSIINFEFKDDFFGFIRSCYNKRADTQKYQRLTFALLGVATPSDLVEDHNRTPFNIDSVGFELTGFKLDETEPLQKGLQGKFSNPKAILKIVLDWTGGQPFLTQKFCQLIYNFHPSQDDDKDRFIKKLVETHVINNWLTQDNPVHLRAICDRLLKSQHSSEKLLKLYQKILQRGAIAANNSREQIELQLSGLVVRQDGKLKVYNRIYKSVFNLSWVSEQLNNLQTDLRIIPEWTTVFASLVITILVMGMRYFSLLQLVELQAYDRFMQLRPSEPPDDRILVVEVTQQDINRDGGYPLKDATLAKSIEKIVQHKPSAIGLDMHRYQSRTKSQNDSGRQKLVAQFQHHKNLFIVCGIQDERSKNHSIDYQPPKEFTEEQLTSQVGFSDVLTDETPDRFSTSVRRQLLSYGKSYATSRCKTPYSLSFQLASQFLYRQNTSLSFKVYKNQGWQSGQVIFKPLPTRVGGYQNLDGKSMQILLNYRAPDRSGKIAHRVTLEEVLDGTIELSLIKNRIVLIGYAAQTIAGDNFNTPYGNMAGVWIHAQMTSQILSSILDRRSLLGLTSVGQRSVGGYGFCVD